jgi:hypothetical protein
MQLKFDGQSIYNNGVDGPYYVRDVYVYNTSNIGESTYIYDAYVATAHWVVGNEGPTANAGPDQIVERSALDGAAVTLDGSASTDPEGDPLTYEWTWSGGAASGVMPTATFPPGSTTVTLTVSDGALTSSDTCEIVVVDTTAPSVTIINPTAGDALQDGVTLTARGSDISGVDKVYFYVREPGGPSGIPIGQEDLVATLRNGTSEDGTWKETFDTTVLQDGYYVILAKAVDSYGNEGWSALVNVSVRNWAVVELLPSSESNKAGRTMPVKFSLRVSGTVDPSMPFVYNEELEVRIFNSSNPGNILQTAHYGDSREDYRIDSVGEQYITNFKTERQAAEYTVQIWRMNKNWMVGDFTFETVINPSDQ